MAVKYVQLAVSVHGLNADEEALNFLTGWIRAATKAALLGHQRDKFKFRNEFDSDIEVEITEQTEG